MKSILILSTYCFGKVTANGLCAQFIKRSLQDMGYDVHIVGYADMHGMENNNSEHAVDISHLKPSNEPTGVLGSICYSFKRLIIPSMNGNIIDYYSEFTNDMFSNKKYDAVIVMYFPIELITIATTLKKKNHDTKLLLYELDSATDGVHPGGRGDKLFDKSYIRWMKKQYKIIDHVFAMKCHEDHIRKLYGKELNGKLSIVDIPLLANNTDTKTDRSDGLINFFYTGILSSNYRSPDSLLKMIASDKTQDAWRFHFYSKGDCENLIVDFAKNDLRIVQHGYVSSKELKTAMLNSDFLISIGNANSNSIPSKLINYMSQGKPIIHFSYQESDICKDYLNMYPYALILDVSANKEHNLKLVKAFVEQNIGKRVDYKYLKNRFYMNTPEFSAQAISNVLKGE